MSRYDPEQYARESIEARAEKLAEKTILAEKEALVMAWTEAGASRNKIADEIDRAVTTVDDHRQRIKRKLREAEQTTEMIDYYDDP